MQILDLCQVVNVQVELSYVLALLKHEWSYFADEVIRHNNCAQIWAVKATVDCADLVHRNVNMHEEAVRS